MDVPCGGQVLLVGDGDFSFTLSLMKRCAFSESQVTTSNLESLDSIQQHKLAADNMQALTEMGVQVFLETDARELHTHPVISQDRYQRIIFNFPLADRHNIKRNRALLVDFFSSCSQILSDDGEVMVTLCKGQGGTPADQPMRSWHDSWQVQAMASNAGFLLGDVVPFEASLYPEYHSVGFRFQDKSFNTEGALTHIFQKGDVVVCIDACARGVVESGSSHFTCSHYLATRINRNLLQESHNPLCLLRHRLETSFSLDLAAEIIPEQPNWRIIPGHKSRTSIRPRAQPTEGMAGTNVSRLSNGDGSGDNVKSDKERKNEENLATLKRGNAALLQHGIDRGDTCLEYKVTPSLEDEEHEVSKFIPQNPESVFILIKRRDDDAAGVDLGGGSSFKAPTAKNSQVDDSSKGNCLATNGSVGSCSESDRNMCSHSKEGHSETLRALRTEHASKDIGVKIVDGPTDENTLGCFNRVFHCRASLLENLSDICNIGCGNGSLRTGQGCSSNHLCSSELSAHSTHIQAGTSEIISNGGQHVGASSLGNLGEDLDKNLGLLKSTSFGGQCFVMSGQCFLPGFIEPDTLAARHEMMVVQVFPVNTSPYLTQRNADLQPPSQISNIPQNASASAESNCNEGTEHLNGSKSTIHLNGSKSTGHLMDQLTKNSISEHLLACLQKSDLFLHFPLSVQDVNSSSEIINLAGFQGVSNLKVIYMESQPTPEAAKQHTRNKECKLIAGFMFQVTRSSQQMLVSILNLDNIACQICRINDPRMLWSRSAKFTKQFQTFSFPRQFTPFSLYPLKFSHDLSFWQIEPDFDVGEMRAIIQNIAGDFVCQLDLIDLYTDPSSGQQSRCYRLHFLSHDMVLPYLISWKLQSLIRMEVSRKLGVTLR